MGARRGQPTNLVDEQLMGDIPWRLECDVGLGGGATGGEGRRERGGTATGAAAARKLK